MHFVWALQLHRHSSAAEQHSSISPSSRRVGTSRVAGLAAFSRPSLSVLRCVPSRTVYAASKITGRDLRESRDVNQLCLHVQLHGTWPQLCRSHRSSSTELETGLQL